MSPIYLLIVVLVAAVALLAVISRATPGKRRPGGMARSGLTERQREVAAGEWTQVRELVSLGRPSNLQTAVIEADKLLDYALKARGASGTTLGERLRSAESAFSDYDGAWQAHKLRNRLVHESEYEPRKSEVERAIGQFERSLRDLGALR